MSELIAEARVLVTPDTTAFRSLLVKEVAAASSGVTVPITVTPIVAGGAAAADAASLAGARAATESAARVASTTNAASAARAQFARTEAVVAAAEKRAAVATTEAAAAQIRYSAALTSSAAAQRAYQLALTTTDEVLTLQSGLVVAITQENEALALSNLNVARSEAAKNAALSKGATAQAASLGQLSRGAGASALALTGLRGATLAATGPFLIGAAGAVALGKAIGIATGFNQQLSVFAATTGATADEMERVSVAAQQLGKDLTLPGVSAGDAAEAMTEFAKAGLSVNDAITATRGGLQLATAAQLSNADAVELTASALNAFKLSGDQAVSVADTLANAANAAQGSIADIGLGLKQAAGAAAVVGVSFQDTTALLTLLAKNGLTASDAGTSLRTAFIRLVNPSKAAQKILKDLNVQLRDAQGNVRPEVFAEFARAQRNLAVSTQQANAAIVFGQDAFRAFGVLSREGTAGLQDTRVELNKTGTAAKVAGARMVGVAGATANLKNQLEALGLTIGEVTSGPLAGLLNELATYAVAAQVATEKSVGLAKGIAGIADSVPAGGFLIDVSKTAFKFGNIIGQINTFKNLLNRGGDDTQKQAEKTGLEIRDALEESGRVAALGAQSFGDQITTALDDAFALFNKALAQKAKDVRQGQFQAVARGGGQQSGLEELFNQIVAGGGSDQQQIANLQRQAAVQAKIIREAGPNAAGDLLKARRAAQEKLASINTQIVSIEKGIAADQKATNDAVQRIRDDAKRARDQAFLQAQEDARDRQARLVTRAEDTPQLADDIRRQEQLRALIKKQIAGLRASTVDDQAKAAALRDLRKARDATTDEIQRLGVANKKQIAQQRADALAQIGENLSLRTQIAEARDAGTTVIVRRIDAEIANQLKVVARAKKAGKGVLEAILALEQLRQKKRDLLNQVKETTTGFSGFEFLQKTQGFASNLLGNLIPGFATGGLVGNVSPVQTARPVGDFGDVPVLPQIARPGDRGVRPVQVDTTNALLRQILAAVSGGRAQTPPETTFNRRWATATWDSL